MLFGSGRSQFAKLFSYGLLRYFMSVPMDWVRGVLSTPEPPNIRGLDSLPSNVRG